MIDQTSIKLLDLIGTSQIKKVANTDGGEWAGPCPFCGGRDRFRVVPAKGRWYCKTCQEKGGDALAFVMRRDDCDFKTAMSTLGLSAGPRPPAWDRIMGRQSKIAPQGNISDPKLSMTEEWQKIAHQFHFASVDCLHSSQGRIALAYLTDERKLSESALNRFLIGYNPSRKKIAFGDDFIWLPKGIVIPWIQNGWEYLKLNIRRDADDLLQFGGDKYHMMKGSRNGFFCDPNATELVEKDSNQLIGEGELDMLAFLSATLRPDIDIKATGSNKGGRTLRNLQALQRAQRIAQAFDGDTAGEEGSLYWLNQKSLAGKISRLTPLAHDINDMVIQGMDVDAWVEPIFGAYIAPDKPSLPIEVILPTKSDKPIEATMPPLQEIKPLETILPSVHVEIDINRRNAILGDLETLVEKRFKIRLALDVKTEKAHREFREKVAALQAKQIRPYLLKGYITALELERDATLRSIRGEWANVGLSTAGLLVELYDVEHGVKANEAEAA